MEIVPIYTEARDEFFSQGISPCNAYVDGIKVYTKPLAFGKSVNLLEISESDQLFASGSIDRTDHLGDKAYVSSIWIRSVKDKGPTRLAVITLSEFNHSFERVPDMHGRLILGGDQGYTEALITDVPGYVFKVKLTGHYDIEFGTVCVSAEFSYMNSLDDSTCEVIGYDIFATRVNPNRIPA